MHVPINVKFYHRYCDGLVFRIVNFKWSGGMLIFCTNILCMLMIGGGGGGNSVVSDPHCGYRTGNTLTALCILHLTAV
jgi:hypothetical protein